MAIAVDQTGQRPQSAPGWGAFWQAVQQTVDARLGLRLRGPQRFRMPALIIPLAGLQAPSVGFVACAAVTFNCRIVGYTIAALGAGQITLDIRRSTVAGHPQTDSLPGVGQLPSLNGTLSVPPLAGTDAWASRELADGDMLWVYATQVSGTLGQAQLILRLQDLDEQVTGTT